jgi:hypothetical protein
VLILSGCLEALQKGCAQCELRTMESDTDGVHLNRKEMFLCGKGSSELLLLLLLFSNLFLGIFEIYNHQIQ